MERRLAINTLSEVFDEANDSSARNARYEPLTYDALEQLDARLSPEPEDVLYDLGCGKGRIVCWFARKTLKRCVGVEFDAHLSDEARANAASLAGRKTPIEIRTGDASLEDYSDATIITMYNPFGREVMQAVLEKLSVSLDLKPRRLQIIYAAPFQLGVFENFPRFVEVGRMNARYDLGRMTIIFFEAN